MSASYRSDPMPPSSMYSIDRNSRAKISASPLEAFWNMSATSSRLNRLLPTGPRPPANSMPVMPPNWCLTLSAILKKVSCLAFISVAAIAWVCFSDCSDVRRSISVLFASSLCCMKRPSTSHRNASGANAPSRKLPITPRVNSWSGSAATEPTTNQRPPPIQMKVTTSPNQMRQSRSEINVRS